MRNIDISNKNSHKLFAGLLGLVIVSGMTGPAFAQEIQPIAQPELHLLTGACAFVPEISVGGTGTCEYIGFGVFEIWESIDDPDARLYFEFSELTPGANYQVLKHIDNDSGVGLSVFSHELLDPEGQEEDANDQGHMAPWTFPAFPAGFSHSNDQDGLSFAMDSGLPRTSDTWPNLFVDEVDTRDFLEWSGAVLADGDSDMTEFHIRENFGTQQAFLLAEAPAPIRDKPVGGTVGSMSTTTLLVAGAQSDMGMWSLALVGMIAAGAAVTYKVRTNKSKQ